MSSVERFREAVRVGDLFWEALAADDDDALAPLLSPIWDDRPASGFSALYRQDRDLAAETCRFLGLATSAELLASDRVRFRYVITDRVLRFDTETPMTAWRLELVEIDGRWLVDRSSDRLAISHIDLTPLFPDVTADPSGPIQ